MTISQVSLNSNYEKLQLNSVKHSTQDNFSTILKNTDKVEKTDGKPEIITCPVWSDKEPASPPQGDKPVDPGVIVVPSWKDEEFESVSNDAALYDPEIITSPVWSDKEPASPPQGDKPVDPGVIVVPSWKDEPADPELIVVPEWDNKIPSSPFQTARWSDGSNGSGDSDISSGELQLPEEACDITKLYLKNSMYNIKSQIKNNFNEII